MQIRNGRLHSAGQIAYKFLRSDGAGDAKARLITAAKSRRNWAPPLRRFGATILTAHKTRKTQGSVYVFKATQVHHTATDTPTSNI